MLLVNLSFSVLFWAALIFLFVCVFLRFHLESSEDYEIFLAEYFKSKIKPLRNKIVIVILILFIGSLAVGSYIQTPELINQEKQIDQYSVEGAHFYSSYTTFTEQKTRPRKSVIKVFQKFTFKPLFWNWLIFDTDFNVTRCSMVRSSCDKIIDFFDNHIVLKLENYNETNITLWGEEPIDFVKDNVTYSYNYTIENDTVIVNITVFNDSPNEISFSNSKVSIPPIPDRDKYVLTDYWPKEHLNMNQKVGNSLSLNSWYNVGNKGVGNSINITLEKAVESEN